jgi:hypothetical protein
MERMKPEQVVEALEEAAAQFGLEVRWETGRFRGGRCMINGRPLIVLNKRHPSEVHLALLAEALHAYPVDTIFLRPAVREALEAAWDRHAETLRQALFEPEEADAD